MKPARSAWDGRKSEEGAEGLSEHTAILLDRLTAKLARHAQEAERLAEVMHHKQRRF